MVTDITSNDILNYVILVDKMNDFGDTYKIGQYSDQGFIEDAKYMMRKHRGITSMEEAKLLLCAKMEPNPRRNVESTIQRVTERVDSINDVHRMDEVASRVNMSIN